jgi:hypothetical protein
LISSIVAQLKEEGGSYATGSESIPSEESNLDADGMSLASSDTTKSTFDTGTTGDFEDNQYDGMCPGPSQFSKGRSSLAEERFTTQRTTSPKTSCFAELQSPRLKSMVRSPCTPKSARFYHDKSPSSTISEIKSPALIGELSAVLRIRRDSSSKSLKKSLG